MKRALAVFLALVFAACRAPRQDRCEVTVSVSPASVGARGITRVRVTVAPAGVEQDLACGDEGTFSGTIRVPAGPQKITAEALVGARAVASATASVLVGPDAAAFVSLSPRAPRAAEAEDHSPVVVSLVVPRTTVDVGDSLHLAARAVDADARPVRYAWTAHPAGCGSFSDAQARAPLWTALAPGRCTLSVTATARGGSDARSSSVLAVPGPRAPELGSTPPTRAATRANDAAASDPVSATLPPSPPSGAAGPLRQSEVNPRYFADPRGHLVLLAGAHTWANLQDSGHGLPPPRFDWPAYLDRLAREHHDFIRLWVWEGSRWTVQTTDDQYWFDPMPFERTGPGTALDGLPRFDVTRFDASFFDRLRGRVQQAGARGIYVSIMLFNGWSVVRSKPGTRGLNAWHGHPFHRANNVNGIDGDPSGDDSGEKTHELRVPAVTRAQEAYVRKVIDTVNDLDNVLFEISNESHAGSLDWQYHMIDLVKSYEATKPRQHPVGMTAIFPGGTEAQLEASPADWIAPSRDLAAPPVADGDKVVIADTDHLCGICGDRAWVWRAFTRGQNPVFMDGYDGAGYGVGGAGFRGTAPQWVDLRKNLGYALELSRRVELPSLRPAPHRASTGFCLASAPGPGAQLVVYVPGPGSVTVDLSGIPGPLAVEWLSPADGSVAKSGPVDGLATRTLTSPLAGDAVLILR